VDVPGSPGVSIGESTAYEKSKILSSGVSNQLFALPGERSDKRARATGYRESRLENRSRDEPAPSFSEFVSVNRFPLFFWMAPRSSPGRPSTGGGVKNDGPK
jgi:hypothetical protein